MSVPYISCSVMDEIEKRSEASNRKLRELQLDLIYAEKMVNLSFKQEKEQHQSKIDDLNQQYKNDKRQERRFTTLINGVFDIHLWNPHFVSLFVPLVTLEVPVLFVSEKVRRMACNNQQ